jgi:D-serine deaminase-like pyridoxal phosphate-dependent protein
MTMTDDERLHRALIGQQGSRRALNTPALTLDRDALDRNIAQMAAFARSKGVALRPHAKTHKSADIARRQIAAGAVGVCCAKLGEAEALAGATPSILITSPVVAAPAIERLIALNDRIADLKVVVDHPANAAALAAAARRKALKVLVDIDPGIHRTGVANPEAALALARAIGAAPQLRYEGVQFYCGAQQHIASFEERRAAIEERTAYLKSTIAALTQAGLAPLIVTGSGTGTHRIDAEFAAFTEWQVGSYVFMDRQYEECDLSGDGAPLYEPALFIESGVVSANTPGMATLDAGFKALSTDGGAPRAISGAPEGARFIFMGDEHGAIFDPARTHQWRLDDRVILTAPHCDPTVNLYDAYHVVSGDTLIDIWPVTARGRSR